MRFFINANQRKTINSTCYLEVQEGQYHDKCWLDSSIYISIELWEKFHISNLIREVVPEFDFYGIAVITKEYWINIVKKSQIEECFCKEIIAEVVPWATKFFKTNDVFTILGM